MSENKWPPRVWVEVHNNSLVYDDEDRKDLGTWSIGEPCPGDVEYISKPEHEALVRDARAEECERSEILLEALEKIMNQGVTSDGNTLECMIAYEAIGGYKGEHARLVNAK